MSWQVYGPFNSTNGHVKMTARRGSQVIVADGLTAAEAEAFAADPQIVWAKGRNRPVPMKSTVSA